MIPYLLGSICCSTLIVFTFKLFRIKGVDTFQAIVFNYLTCLTLGSSISGFPIKEGFLEQEWLPYAFGLGCLFICSFYLIALTVQTFGAAIAAVTQKMSLIISVSFAILMYQELVNNLKLFGLFLALLAVILTNIPNSKSQTQQINWKLLWLPVSMFLFSGVVECTLQYVKVSVLQESNPAGFVTTLFGTAAIWGVLALTFRVLFLKLKLKVKTILWGMGLGVINYGSIYFLMQALGEGGGSVIYPINNISVISLAAIGGYFLFKEKLSRINISGIITAIVAITLIAWTTY